jgi:hypothetical protein
MTRPRIYATGAERQRAYRRRLAERRQDHNALPVVLPKLRRPPSRPARLAALSDDLQQLRQEYACWLESLPESLCDGELADRLRETVEQMDGVLDMLSDLRLPLGFGRD